MFFKKRVLLSAHAAGQAALALVIVANYLKNHDDDAALSLLAVAGQLLPGKTVRVGPALPSQPPLSRGLDALIALTEGAAVR
jgi:hypothetical protein